MSKESMLQKEFKESDVQRMRNLITKDFHAKTKTQVGYKKEDIEHKEGDTWEENNKTWAIKNGIKMTVSKLDEVKKVLQMPFICPKCSKVMKNPFLDKKMYFIHKMCFNCVIEHETELRREGKYEEYEKKLMSKNMDVYIDELNQLFKEIDISSNEDIVTEEGEVEQWVGGKVDIQKMKDEFRKYIDSIQKVRESMT